MDNPGLIRPELLEFSSDQLIYIMPYFWLLMGALVSMILGVIPKKAELAKWPVFATSVVGLLMSIWSTWQLMDMPGVILFNQMFKVDGFSNIFNLIFLGSALFTVLASFRYLDKEKLQLAEFYVLVLFSTFGMMVMASSLDLVVLFVALELMSLSVYTLVGFRRADRKSNEASLKYFILGGVASAIMLYGVSLLYGVTASTNINVVLYYIQTYSNESNLLFTLGAWLLIIGFLFKIASVPFHMWMPDVYEGAPVTVTGFMTTGIKAASFAAFVRVFLSLGLGRGLSETVALNIHNILWILAVLSMIIANVVALTQSNLKRMLAYSSIAHTGYLLVGMIAGYQSEEGFSPLIVYLVAYSLMNLGAFIVLSIISSRNDEQLNIHDLSGLSRRRPWLAFGMSVFMLSLAGIPGTAGFIGKYMLFYSAVQAGEISLVVISVLCSAVSVYYYLRVIVYMYMRDPVGAEPNSRIPLWSALSVGIMVFMTLEFGIFPSRLLEVAKTAFAAI